MGCGRRLHPIHIQYFETKARKLSQIRLKSSFNMDGLVEYTIPVKGLGNGIHPFHFHIGREFFEQFEDSPVREGDIELDLTFDKRTDMFVFTFQFEGTVKTECDRCLASIDLPISGQERLIVKFSLEDEEDEADVTYVHPEISKFNVARFIYEFIVLAIPMIKIYDCEEDEQPACNQEMLDFLESNEEPAEPEDTANPIWEELKKFNPEKE
jgi:uncharacterized protein